MDGTGEGVLQESVCPWGGSLLKLRVKVMVEEALEMPGTVIRGGGGAGTERAVATGGDGACAPTYQPLIMAWF